ncbi:MAG: hypothetical protein ACREUU_02500, partial [Gammaproteobacteria bacterium]
SLPVPHASLRDADIRGRGPWAEAHGCLHPASLRDGGLVAILRAPLRRGSERLGANPFRIPKRPDAPIDPLA